MKNENQYEREIANEAAKILRKCFITTAHSERVLYVENDSLISKNPDGAPVFIRQLPGRNPEISHQLNGRRTFKIKKRQVEE